MNELETARAKIDQVDRQLVRLLEERYQAIQAVSDYKKAHDLPALNADREKAVLAQVEKQIKEVNYQEAIVETFKNMMTISKEWQNKQK